MLTTLGRTAEAVEANACDSIFATSGACVLGVTFVGGDGDWAEDAAGSGFLVTAVSALEVQHGGFGAHTEKGIVRLLDARYRPSSVPSRRDPR
jgi:hypothetical protein